LAFGVWRSAFGVRRLAFGVWRLAFGARYANGFATLFSRTWVVPLTAKALNRLEPLNRVLERDQAYGVIVPRSADRENPTASSGFELRRLRLWSTPNALLLPIAEALAHLVCSEDFSLVKGCEGKTCTLLFLDRTHGRARRWCSMTICGNRAKQAAHRQRSAKKRKSPSKSPKRIAD
jgi:hypothetical protein